MKSIADVAQRRYTCKAYDPSKKIPKDAIEQLYTVLRNSPSSVNSQPWHFMIAESDAAKEKILPAIFEFNRPRILNASHVVIFLSRNEFPNQHLPQIDHQEEQDQRSPKAEMKETNDKGRRYFVGLSSDSQADLHNW